MCIGEPLAAGPMLIVSIDGDGVDHPSPHVFLVEKGIPTG